LLEKEEPPLFVHLATVENVARLDSRLSLWGPLPASSERGEAC